MKVAFNESLKWERANRALILKPGRYCQLTLQQLAHLHMLINKEYLAIPNEYDKLIISLRTAYANEYPLDKEQTSYSDSLDALRLSCKMYPIKDES